VKEIPFFAPSVDGSELDEIKDVFSLDKESKVLALENMVKKYIGVNEVISTSSGTSALHLAMCAIDLKRGDKIICSVNAFPNVPAVVRHFDAEPIFVDINLDDFNINIEQLEKALIANKSKKLKAMIITHVAGQPAEMDKIYELAQKYKVLVIEDATNALGAKFNGNLIGSKLADMTAFSFNPNLSKTISNGGVLTTNSEELGNRARILRNHAIETSGWDKYGNLNYIYDVVDIGWKYDLSELEAAYSLAQLKKIDSCIKRRKEIASIYSKEFSDLKHITLPVEKREHIYSQYIIKVDKNRDAFAKDLQKSGISVAMHFVPLHLLKYYKEKYSLKVNAFPNALKNYQQILSLPIYPALKSEKVNYIVDEVKKLSKSWI